MALHYQALHLNTIQYTSLKQTVHRSEGLVEVGLVMKVLIYQLNRIYPLPMQYHTYANSIHLSLFFSDMTFIREGFYKLFLTCSNPKPDIYFKIYQIKLMHHT